MPDGKRVQRTTKETDRRKAQRLADQFEEATRAKLTARAAQRVITEIYARATGEKLPSSTIRAYFESWLARKKPETAEATSVSYGDKAQRFLSFLGDRADQEITRLSTPDIIAFRAAEAERVSAGSVNDALKVLRMIFTQAQRDGVLVDNPAEGVKRIKKQTHSQRRPFTLPELERLLSFADQEWRSLVLFGFYTGARLGDIANLIRSEVDLKEDEIRWIATKRGRRMILPIPTPLRRHIETLSFSSDPNQRLHPKAADIMAKQKGRVGTLSGQFYRLMAKAGLVPAKSHKRNTAKAATGGGRGRGVARNQSEICFHCLRHTATSLMKNAGVSSAIVQEYMGHESEAVNRVYTHIEIASMRRAAETLPTLT